MANNMKSSPLSSAFGLKTGITILRILIPFFLIYNHGFGKVVKVINGNFQFGDPIGIGVTASLILAAFAEGICALLVLIGFKARLASIPLIINFMVAIFFYHFPSGDSFGAVELPFIYLIFFIGILFADSGPYSVDSLSGNSRKY